MNIILLLFPVFVFFKDGKWGLVNQKGRIVKDAIFEELEDPNAFGFAIAGLNGKYGVLDSLGNFVLAPNYKSLSFLSDSFLIGMKDSLSFICNTKGEELANSNFDSVSYGNQGNRFLFSPENKKGMILGTDFLLPIYDSIWFSDKYWFVEKENKKGVFTESLKQILAVEFEEIKPAFEYFIVKKNDLFGLYDANGLLVFSCGFSKIELIDGNHMVATDKEGKAKLYDIERRVSLVEGKYDKIRFLPGFEEYFLIEKDVFEGLIDKKGKVLIDTKFDQIAFIGMGCLAATDSLGDHMYSFSGKRLSKIPLGEIDTFDSIPVTKIRFNGGKGAVNKFGEVLLLPTYNYVEISKDKILYFENGRKNIISFDEQGRFVEVIKNFGTIRISDTTIHESHSFKQRSVIRSKGDRFGMTILSNIVIPISRNGNMTKVSNYFLFDSTINRTLRSASSFLDISLKTINQAEVAPAISTAGKLVLVNRKGRIFSTLSYKNAEGKRFTKPFGSVGRFSEGLAPVNFANASENYKLKYSYRFSEATGLNSIEGVLDGLETNVLAEDGNWGFMNQKGEVPIYPRFLRVQQFQNGHAIVKLNQGQYGLINALGTDVWNSSYPKVERVSSSDSLYYVHKTCNVVGFMNKSFTMAFAPKYKDIKAIGNKLVLVKCKNRMWAFKRLNGIPLTDSIFSRARPFSEGKAAVYYLNSWGFIDTNGRMILKPKYNSATDFIEGRAFVTIGGKSKIINTLGQVIAKGDFKGEPFFDGFSVIAKNKKYGIMQLDGEWLVSPQFESITKFDSSGNAIAVKEKVLYRIQKSGEVSKMESGFTFSKKKSSLLKNGFYERLNKYFPNVSIPDEKSMFLHQSFDESEYVPYKPVTYMGIVSDRGNVILPPIYQYICSMTDGVFKVFHLNSVGYYKLNEGWIFKPWN